MKPIICFIDDSDFEHDLVREEIASSVPDLEFIQAYTYDEARDLLGKRIPTLFLLDLWGQDMEVKKPYLTPKEEMQKRISQFNTLDTVYDGLENFSGDRTNEFLKRFFTIVDSWRNLFQEVCDRIGQNGKYGLGNLKQVRKDYPGVPAVFYTRKSLINDAVAMLKAGADGLMIKPSGKDDVETRSLTREKAPGLIEELSLIVDTKMDQMKKIKDSLGNEMMAKKSAMEDLISGWKEFRIK